jgi:hypothetical protein
MRLVRSLIASVLVGAALLTTGCGGSSGTKLASGSAPDTAGLAPKDAAVWAFVDTDRTSGQWQALDAVLAKIPGAENLLDQALNQIGSTEKKLDFQTDVQPALGKAVVVVLTAGSSDPVVLLKPTDEAKLRALLQTATTPPVTGTRDGWTEVAQTQKGLDAYEAALGGGTLADSDLFARAMNGLPQEALARVYVDTKGLAPALTKAAGTAGGALGSLPIPGVGKAAGTQGSIDAKALARLGTIGLAISAGDHTLRVDGSVETSSDLQPQAFSPTLLERVPGDALAAFSFSGQGATKQLQDAIAGAGAKALDQLRQSLGVSLDELVGLADGQVVAYVRPGLIIPEVTVVLDPRDPAQALQTLDTVAAKLAGRFGGKVTETTQGTRRLKQVRVSILSIVWGRDGDRVVLTTAPRGIDDFDGGGAKLVDSARFKRAAADVGLGKETGGFAYVDVKGLAPLLDTLASAAGSGSDATFKKVVDALSAIDGVAFNSAVDGKRVTVQGVLRVG